MYFPLEFIAIAGVVIAASSLFMSLLMFSTSRSGLTWIWGTFCLAVSLWGISFYFIVTSPSESTALIWWKVSHVGVILMPVLFVHFVYSFIGKINKIVLWLIYSIGGIFLLTDVATDLLVGSTDYLFDSFYYNSGGPLYLLFFIFFHLLIVYGHVLLLIEYFKSKRSIKREQIRYFFLATFVGFLGGGLSFAPVFGIDIYPSTIITVALYPVVMGYAIMHFKLFNLRVVAAQIVAVLILIFTFIRLFDSKTVQDLSINIVFLIVVMVISIYLIKSVEREVKQRELAQKLATELAGANMHLERIDKTKSEFLSIASHQLRSPLTSIRGYVSMILEGSYGEVNPKVREVLQHVAASSENMAMSIGDYLNISRIEAGNMKYDLTDCDVRKLTEDTVAEIMPTSTLKKLSLSFRSTFSGPAMVKLDIGKTKQIIQNLIDNAIKYTPENGVITVLVSKDGEQKKVLIKIMDTGIGISEEEIVALFEKFSRAKLASSVNVNGTGLGLYIAREMTRAMEGEITVASSGEGKGTTFTISFPLNGIESKWSDV